MAKKASFPLTWFSWLVLVAAWLLVLALGLTALGAARWAAAAQSLTDSLVAAQEPVHVARHDARALVGLPAPVQRYFEAVLTDGQSMITAAGIGMTGRFNLSSTGAQWRPFTSRQQVRTRRPGFVWDARIAMLPGMAVRVVDSYIGGQGLLKASVQGLFPVAGMQGAGEIARGEFMRYFAEAVWYPTALLPSQGVRWEAVDDRSANATLTDGAITLTLLFRFDAAGLIESFRAESRGGMVGQVMVQAPWEGRFSNYQRHDGMLVPHAGEVAWMRPEGRQVYFEGTVTRLHYSFTP